MHLWTMNCTLKFGIMDTDSGDPSRLHLSKGLRFRSAPLLRSHDVCRQAVMFCLCALSLFFLCWHRD